MIKSIDTNSLHLALQPTRLKILESLRLSPKYITQIAKEIKESPRNCSFHLEELKKVGFVECKIEEVSSRACKIYTISNIGIMPLEMLDSMRKRK